MVANRDGLEIATVQGEMTDLSDLPDKEFDLSFHPVSNFIIPDVMPVWREAFRVAKSGGAMVAGFNNSAVYVFDFEHAGKTGGIRARYKLPYSDPEVLGAAGIARYEAEGTPFEFSHFWADLVGGQLAAGWRLTDLYEDPGELEGVVPSQFMPFCIATRAVKLWADGCVDPARQGRVLRAKLLMAPVWRATGSCPGPSYW